MFKKIKHLFERISPIAIEPGSTYITVGISKRFLLFEGARRLARKIEDDPHLNFIAGLKRYKAFGNFLTGTIWELYRDRNRPYVRNFFLERQLYKKVKEDIEWAYERNQDFMITITKRGVIVYDNYKKNSFNVLLITPHSGQWLPQEVYEKQVLTKEARAIEEDIDTHKIYGGLVLAKGGIWIDNKLSRFACDYNRDAERAIYTDKSESWITDKMWKEPLSASQRAWLMEGYEEFYVTLQNLIDSYRFNIIFDGHSMKDMQGRPEISFGTEFIPRFYMPVVISMRKKLSVLGYTDVRLNSPYRGGNLIRWMHNRFPDVFVFSVEVNKKLYTSDGKFKSKTKKIETLANNITNIFDIEVEV